METRFDFSIGNSGTPSVKLTGSGLVFNQASIAALGYPEYVNIGIDSQTLKLGVIPARDNENKRYRFSADKINQKRILIPNFKLRKSIITLTNSFPMRKGIIYETVYDNAVEMLVVDLKQTVS